MKAYRRLWVALIMLAFLSPVGLYLPSLLKAGSAWGEWGVDELQQRMGYTPSGMQKKADTWTAPISGYALPGQEQAPPIHLGYSYILSACVGLVVCGGGGYLLTHWVRGSRRKHGT
jgi:hypothetical protein